MGLVSRKKWRDKEGGGYGDKVGVVFIWFIYVEGYKSM